jgi:ESS family glutamate:Na+ symporter
LDRLNIPAAVVGGLIYAVLTTVARDRWINFEMDLVLRDILMVAFFTTIGMSASLALLRAGGAQVAIFFGVATVGAVLQNGVGAALASLLGIQPLLGVVAGSVALTGGPATALAFGRDFEERFALVGAVPFGLASAMFGIVAGGLLAGAVGGGLVARHNLRQPRKTAAPSAVPASEAMVYSKNDPGPEPTVLRDESESEHGPLMAAVIAVAVAMGIGTLISFGLESIRIGDFRVVLPAYVGSMFAAAILRNIDDFTNWFHISQREMDALGSVALNIFIVMALLTLRLWELVQLALPMLVILLAQLALVWIMAILIFRLMGRDFDAAVMASGFSGFMLGTTANAMAGMEVLTGKYGPAPRAYLVVPIVGAFLIDFTNAMVITAFANFLR